MPRQGCSYINYRARLTNLPDIVEPILNKKKCFSTHIVLLEDLGVPERVLGRQHDVLQQDGVAHGRHLVGAAAERVAQRADGVGVEAARVDPFGLGRPVLAVHGGREEGRGGGGLEGEEQVEHEEEGGGTADGAEAAAA